LNPIDFYPGADNMASAAFGIRHRISQESVAGVSSQVVRLHEESHILGMLQLNNWEEK
jgi:hypothetical protein